MSRTRYNLDTPIGKVRTVFIAGTRYYLIKDVCVGIGLTGHSPWSWHAKEQDNRAEGELEDFTGRKQNLDD